LDAAATVVVKQLRRKIKKQTQQADIKCTAAGQPLNFAIVSDRSDLADAQLKGQYCPVIIVNTKVLAAQRSGHSLCVP
jgi:hypothetical protein